MKDYRHIISGMTSTPWLIQKDSLAMILDIVNQRLSGEYMDDEDIRLRIEAADNGDREHSRVEVGGGVGIMPLYGPMFPKSNLMTELSGATSLEAFTADLRSLVSNDKVESIVIDIDSPGGASDMTPETGAEIKAATEVKPVYAVANTVAGSGAYWLGSQATKFYSTPSGKVGSIGVYTVHEDRSKQDEAEGRKVSFISAGEFKTAGNPHEPLTSEARAYLQEYVDELMEDFVGAVMEGRGMDREAVLQFADGRLFSASKGTSLGMIDGVKTLDDVVGPLLNSPIPATRLHSAMTKHHENAKTFTSAEVLDESVEKEHSEPGTIGPDGEPIPKTDDDGDRGQKGGSRIDTPPIELEDKVGDELTLEAAQEQLGAAQGQLTQLREVFSLDSDADLLAHARSVNDELAPLREAREAAEERKSFRTEFPSEFEEMQELKAVRVKDNAKEFAGNYERFVKDDGTVTTQGFAQRTIGDIEEAHKALADGSITEEHLSNMLNSIAEVGIVEYKERGSARAKEPSAIDPSKPRNAFFERVKEVAEQNELTFEKAIPAAAKMYPDEYEAYRSARVVAN